MLVLSSTDFADKELHEWQKEEKYLRKVERTWK